MRQKRNAPLEPLLKFQIVRFALLRNTFYAALITSRPPEHEPRRRPARAILPPATQQRLVPERKSQSIVRGRQV